MEICPVLDHTEEVFKCQRRGGLRLGYARLGLQPLGEAMVGGGRGGGSQIPGAMFMASRVRS